MCRCHSLPISQRSVLARQRFEFGCGLSEQRKALLGGRELTLLPTRIGRYGRCQEPEVTKADIVRVLFVFRVGRGYGAFQHFGGVVEFQ